MRRGEARSRSIGGLLQRPFARTIRVDERSRELGLATLKSPVRRPFAQSLPDVARVGRPAFAQTRSDIQCRVPEGEGPETARGGDRRSPRRRATGEANHASRLLATSLLLALVTAPQSAAADEPLCREGEDNTICEAIELDLDPGPDRCVYGGNHKPHTRNLLGAKALVVTSLGTTGAAEGDHEHGEHGAEGPFTTFGVSVFYERLLIPKWLELEINVGLVDGAAGLQMPIDLLFKKPFHVNRRLTPYLSLGPALEVFPRGDRSPLLGVTGGLGVYLWLSRDFGVDLELDYTAHFLGPGLEHVTTLGVGPVLHF